MPHKQMGCFSSISFFMKCEICSVTSTMALLHPATRMKLLLVLMSTLSLVDAAGESDVIGSHEPVKAVVGHDVILPCHLEPPFDVRTLTVEWTYNKNIAHIYRNKDDLVDQDEKFRGRTSLFPDEMSRGNISLKLTNVIEQDAGNYTCYVPKLNSQVRKGYVTLIVEKKPEPHGSQTDNDSIVGIVVVGIIVAAIVGAVLLKMRHDKGGRNMGNTEGSLENNPETVILNEEDICNTA